MPVPEERPTVIPTSDIPAILNEHRNIVHEMLDRMQPIPRKVYHGWIYKTVAVGFNDSFTVFAYADDKETEGGAVSKHTGYTAAGVAKAVAYFENDLKLGYVELEQTPVGIRVFTTVYDFPTDPDLKSTITGL